MTIQPKPSIGAWPGCGVIRAWRSSRVSQGGAATGWAGISTPSGGRPWPRPSTPPALSASAAGPATSRPCSRPPSTSSVAPRRCSRMTSWRARPSGSSWSCSYYVRDGARRCCSLVPRRMLMVLIEPISQTDTPDVPPADEAEECFTAENVLGFVRDLAAARNPYSAHSFRTVDLNRLRSGARVAQRLLNAHLELRRRMGRGARTGKRAHAAAVRRVLEASNERDLELAAAVLSLPFFFSTPDEREQERAAGG